MHPREQIRGYATHDRLSDALALLNELRAAGLSPDEWTYGPLLDACRLEKKSRVARSLGMQVRARHAHDVAYAGCRSAHANSSLFAS